MSVRTDDRELDLLLADWFDEGPNTAAGFVVERALERVPGVRRRGASWWPRLPRLLRAQGPLLAALIVLLVLGTALVVALAEINRPIIPAPSQPPIATSSPSVAPTQSATPRAAVTRGRFEISSTTPMGSLPSRAFPQFIVVNDRPDGLLGFTFRYDSGNATVSVYLDPEAEYLGSWDTTREDLVVSIFYARGTATSGDQSTRGVFESAAGECQVTFETFTATAASGSLECADVPGTYLKNADGIVKEGVLQLSGTFSFDPSIEPLS